MYPVRNGNRYFRKIIFKPNVLAPVSRLYHWEPIGVGTPDVESLTSYISRLAGAHLLELQTLLRHIIAPLIEGSRLRKFDAEAVKRYVVPSPNLINGGGTLAEVWVRALEELTLRRDLRSLTALPWGASASQRLLLKRGKAWCPSCFEHSRQEGGVMYEPLLWSFVDVSVCPSHRRILEQICPNCKLRPSIITNSPPGHCSRCRGWLGNERHTAGGHIPNSDHRLTASQNVREWVGVAQNLLSPPSRDDSVLRLCNYIDLLTNGRANAFGRLLNISGREVRKWRSQTRMPTVGVLLKIAAGLKTTLAGLLTGWALVVPSLKPEECLERIREGTHLKYLNREEVERAFVAALNEEPPPTIREFAARLGYKVPTQLYSRFPELCRQLSRKSRAAGHYRLQRPRFSEKDKRKMRAALVSALKQSPTPPLTKIAAGLGLKHVITLRRWFPKLYIQVKANRAAGQVKFLEDVKLRLDEVTEEWPPPKPAEVAERFGYKHFSSVNNSFPEVASVIQDRYAEWVGQLKSEVPAVLRDALVQNPPPSLSETATLSEYSLTTLRKYYPELCRAIIERRKNYLRRLTPTRRREFKELVRGMAVDLLHQGQYPSANRVWPLMANRPNLGFVTLTEVLRELRQEMGWHWR